MRRYHASIAEPLSVKLNAGTLYNTPPPTQGLASLIILALYERLRVREAESFEFAHGLVEATKRAFRVRDRVVTDPVRVPQPPAQFLEAKFLDAEVAQDRPPQGGEMAGARWRRRHHLDGRCRLLGARGVLHPVALLGVRLRLRAAARPAC